MVINVIYCFVFVMRSLGSERRLLYVGRKRATAYVQAPRPRLPPAPDPPSPKMETNKYKMR